MAKSPDAFRTITEVSDELATPPHVLRFWESRFPQVRPVKRAGGRRYYRPADLALLGGIKKLLHDDGMTIRGVQKVLREQGARYVAGLGAGEAAAMLDLDAPTATLSEVEQLGLWDGPQADGVPGEPDPSPDPSPGPGPDPDHPGRPDLPEIPEPDLPDPAPAEPEIPEPDLPEVPETDPPPGPTMTEEPVVVTLGSRLRGLRPSPGDRLLLARVRDRLAALRARLD